MLGSIRFNPGVVVDATDWMYFWNPEATNPGDARRMGFTGSIFVIDVMFVLNSS